MIRISISMHESDTKALECTHRVYMHSPSPPRRLWPLALDFPPLTLLIIVHYHNTAH